MRVMEPRASHMLGKYSATEPHLAQTFLSTLFMLGYAVSLAADKNWRKQRENQSQVPPSEQLGVWRRGLFFPGVRVSFVENSICSRPWRPLGVTQVEHHSGGPLRETWLLPAQPSAILRRKDD